MMHINPTRKKRTTFRPSLTRRVSVRLRRVEYG